MGRPGTGDEALAIGVSGRAGRAPWWASNGALDPEEVLVDRTQEAIVAAHARAQHGVVTRAQLLEARLDPSTIRRRVGAGALVVVGSRTYRLASAPPSLKGVVAATCLDRNGVGSHRTSTWLHGHMPEPDVVEVTVARGRSQRGLVVDGVPVVIRATTNLPEEDIIVVDGIRVASVARSLFGLAALVPDEVSFDELVDVVAGTIETGGASVAWLRWLLDRRRCRGRNGVTALEAAIDTRVRQGPTESWLERRYLVVSVEAGLPRPELQRRIPRAVGSPARVDFLHRREGVVIEVLGYAFHRTPEQVDADTMRASELQAEGLVVLQFTSRRLKRDPASVVAVVAANLAARRRAA